MEVKLVILSLACLSCLVPPAFSTPVLAAKLAAAGAFKGAALLGAGLLAKGAILKGTALLAAKAAVLKGAALLAAKALEKKAALAAAKPVLLPAPVAVAVPQPTVVISPPSLSNVGDKLNGVITATKDAVVNKTLAVGQLLASLLPTKTIVSPPRPVVYHIVSPPKFYPVPIFEKILKKK